MLKQWVQVLAHLQRASFVFLISPAWRSWPAILLLASLLFVVIGRLNKRLGQIRNIEAFVGEDGGAYYARGFRDGWMSVPRSGHPPKILTNASCWVLIPGKTFYQSGYDRGQRAAMNGLFSERPIVLP
jgi:hypothetical protein